jgi:HlyD family secretion protein
MKRPLKRILLIAIGLLAVGALVYAFRPRPVEVDVAEVARGPLQVTVDEDGRTRIRERYIVSAPLAGRLQRIRLRAGDEIEAGDTVLASIAPTDPALLDARAQAESEARVRAAEAALERADPQVEAARAALQFAESDLARTRRLHERNAASRDEVERAELLYRTRTQELRSAQFAQEIARFELEQARAALVRTRQPQGNSTDSQNDENHQPDDWHFEIHSPITGRVLRVIQESETVVVPGERLLEVGDPTDLEIEIDVLSSDAVRVTPGDRVLLEQWGGELPLVGVVRTVEPSAFTKVSALGVEEQRVNVIVDLVDPPAHRPTLGDGFRVEARIVVWEDDDVLKVPAGALFRHDRDWAVFVVENGRAVLRTVQIGRRNGLEAQVLDGLEEDELVVAHPGDRIFDGVAVAPRGRG